MNLPETIALILGFLALLPTIASLTRFDQWWIRGFDFPRLQISSFILIVIIYSGVVFDFSSFWEYVIMFLLVFSFLYQGVKIYPYTFFAKKQVHKFKGKDDPNEISILVSNVLATNNNYGKLITLIVQKNPDLVLTLESNDDWEKNLEIIEKQYPYTVKIPQENLYGMHLYSKLELEDIDIKYLMSEEIPSIHGKVNLRSGKKVNIHCLHPKPPSPSEDTTSTNRDAELLMVGKEIEGQRATLVFGDLNDVAWSRTTDLFISLSGLLDPRIGRGFFNTFHAQYPVFRWPLDHVFHSDDFLLDNLKRLDDIGSDHFPIFIKLVYDPEDDDLNNSPKDPDQEERDWADEKIEDGKTNNHN
ncbi:endonuclease/exonuclease/phosphatase family protein [Salinimicrobium terrae]|uniref:endonuclease/exonuclease/phosphatase family protein n=1 Tax=Salinimicrobium terrae TaxID=470866 RepID=UPI00055B71BE|nr:endonuclease/exonuclease/phosphatase family protein [Salinimicrobium terrae]